MSAITQDTYLKNLIMSLTELRENAVSYKAKRYWENYIKRVEENEISVNSFSQLVIYYESGAYEELRIERKVEKLREYLNDENHKKDVFKKVQKYYPNYRELQLKQHVEKVYDSIKNLLSKNKEEGRKIIKYLSKNRDEILAVNNSTGIISLWRYNLYINPLFYLLGILEITNIENKKLQISVNKNNLNKFFEIVPKQIKNEENSNYKIDPKKYGLNERSKRKAEFLYVLENEMRKRGIINDGVEFPLGKEYYDRIKNDNNRVRNILNVVDDMRKDIWRKYFPDHQIPTPTLNKIKNEFRRYLKGESNIFF